MNNPGQSVRSMLGDHHITSSRPKTSFRGWHVWPYFLAGSDTTLEARSASEATRISRLRVGFRCTQSTWVGNGLYGGQRHIERPRITSSNTRSRRPFRRTRVGGADVFFGGIVCCWPPLPDSRIPHPRRIRIGMIRWGPCPNPKVLIEFRLGFVRKASIHSGPPALPQSNSSRGT